MSEIIPAILEDTFKAVREKLSLAVSFAPLVQIDVCDGKFVPRSSWPYIGTRMAADTDDADKRGYDMTFQEVLSEKEGMPYWDKIDFEVDLMVSNPEEVVRDWILAGAVRVIPHVEAVTDFLKLKEKTAGRVSLGLAIGIDTPLATLVPYAEEIDCIQCMGIAKIGYQGQSFDERVLGKISELKMLYPNVTITVDGGVNIETAPRLIAAGANRLVVGSAVFGQANPAEAVRGLESLFAREKS